MPSDSFLKRRSYENEFLPPLTIRYESDELIFPLRISVISSEEPVRITLFIIAEGTVVSANYPTKELVFDRRKPPAAMSSDYIEKLISDTVGEEGRGAVLLWAGELPGWYDGELVTIGINTTLPGLLYLTRLESVIAPSKMTEDLFLVTESSARRFEVVFLKDPMEKVSNTLLWVYLPIVVFRMAIGVLAFIAIIISLMVISKNSEVKNAVLSHYAGLMGLPGPIIIWIFRSRDSRFVREQCRLSVNFQLSIFIYTLFIFYFGIGSQSTSHDLRFIWFALSSLFAIYKITMIVIASFRAGKNKKVSYPLALPFFHQKEKDTAST